MRSRCVFARSFLKRASCPSAARVIGRISGAEVSFPEATLARRTDRASAAYTLYAP